MKNEIFQWARKASDPEHSRLCLLTKCGFQLAVAAGPKNSHTAESNSLLDAPEMAALRIEKQHGYFQLERLAANTD